MPKKPRKTLGDVNAPSCVALRELIDTQSKDTIRKWCLDYANEKMLPLFEKHKHERVCVIGTMCCGKTTLVKHLSDYYCVDVDDVFWPQISEADIEFFSQTPITNEILDPILKLMDEKIMVKPGFPLFGVAILGCEAVVYLDISEQLLKEHCEHRGDTTLDDAIFIKKRIEADWNSHKARNDKTFYCLTITE